ncbi:telomere binding protein [Coemansia sp. Benny D115]|nr:telomere binding protein [Coemansia sp. Benny D115]
MSFKEDVRSKFKQLEKLIEELTGGLSAGDPKKRQPLSQSNTQSTVNESESLLQLNQQTINKLHISNRLGEDDTDSTSLSLSGLLQPVAKKSTSALIRPLITPVGPVAEEPESKVADLDTSVCVDELLAAIYAPLVALGVSDPSVLLKGDHSGCYEWAQWWVDMRESTEPLKLQQFERFLGPWFNRSVIGQQAVTLGIFSPIQVSARINRSKSAVREWADYSQLVCSLPERVANRIDPQDIPMALVPRVYYPNLAQQAVALGMVDRKNASQLWIKLCRVGQADALCVEIAAALLKDQDTDTPRVFDLARAIVSVSAPYCGRLVSGTTRQFVLALESSTESISVGLGVAVAVSALICAQAEHDTGVDAIHLVLTEIIGPCGAASLALCRAVALALQTLSGSLLSENADDRGFSALVSKCLPSMPVFQNLILEALTKVIIPQWSFVDFIARASAEEMKSLTALVLMCVGALSEPQGLELSSSSEFMMAVPRFLDAPVTVAKLSGIIVADTVVSVGRAMGDSKDLDFGLDDIIRDAVRTEQPEIKASAAYIFEMRAFRLPVLEQWQKSTNARTPEAQSSVAREAAVDYLRAYSGNPVMDTKLSDVQRVVAPRQSSLTDGSSTLQSAFVKPRKPVFLRDCLNYMQEGGRDGDNSVEMATMGVFSVVQCIETAGQKTIDELWVQTVNRVLYTYNRGPDELDLAWNEQRKAALVALAVRIPEKMGPFLADRACDRNLTIKDREIVYSAISGACLRLSGLEGKEIGEEKKNIIVELDGGSKGGIGEKKRLPDTEKTIGAGTVVRRSRRLDLVAQKTVAATAAAQNQLVALDKDLVQAQRRFASIVGPSFFFPLVSQYARSDMSRDQTSDVRRDPGQLERLVNTLAIILYVSGSSTHQIRMNREFWDLAKLIRTLPQGSMNVVVVDAVLFGVDVILSPERALSANTLAAEFRLDIADMLRWIGDLAENGMLREGTSVANHAARIVHRLREIQDLVYNSGRVNQGDAFNSIF